MHHNWHNVATSFLDINTFMWITYVFNEQVHDVLGNDVLNGFRHDLQVHFRHLFPANSKWTTAPGKSSICSRTQVERG